MSVKASLEGHTVVVTGASSGIGRAIAERLGSSGARVYLVGRTMEPMDEAVAMIAAAGGKAEAHSVDVRDSAALQAIIEQAASESGRLDVMVNNAGLGHPGAILEGEFDKWREMLDVNVLALLVGSQTAVKAMRRCGHGGRIVNISSIAALRPDSGVYGATKAAVNYLTAALRQELEADDIRITSLMPGVVATNFARNMDADVIAGIAALAGSTFDFVPGQRIPDEALEQAQAGLETHIAKPEDIADAVHYVVSLPARLNIPELIVRPAQSLDF
jgi:NADP-dependent 3-hydroxy acid dehydrogenase YdfG